MCTLSVIALSDGSGVCGLRAVMNRDEERGRSEAAPPSWRELPVAGAPLRAIWPTDQAAGGTWIAARSDGLLLALLNGNPTLRDRWSPGVASGNAAGTRPGWPQRPISRGRLIPALLASLPAGWGQHLNPPALDAAIRGSIVPAADSIDLARLPPFRLVAAAIDPNVGSGQLRVVDARWAGVGGDLQTADWTAPACFASSGLGDQLVQIRLPLFDELVRPAALRNDGHRDAAGVARLQDVFHRHTWPDRPELSVLMARADARTVSITTVDVRAGPLGPNQTHRANPTHVHMTYSPIPAV